MPANRTNLTVDQQFFQELLSAAYTIQEHNDRVNRASPALAAVKARPEPQPQSICPHCGTFKPADHAQCEQCGPDEFRPGERMQRKWASMWLLSQQQGLWPERSAEVHEAASNEIPPLEMKRGPRTAGAQDFAASGILAVPLEDKLAAKGKLESASTRPEKAEPILDRTNGDRTNGGRSNGNRANGNRSNGDRAHDRSNGDSALRKSIPDKDKFEFNTAPAVSNWTTEATEYASLEDLPQEHLESQDYELTGRKSQASATDDLYYAEADLAEADSTDADWNEASDTMRDGAAAAAPISILQRVADWRVKLRYRRADLYLGVAVVVAGFALLWPTAGSPQPATLSQWDRALVTLGIAEVPQPATHLQGDPAAEVWVDPHSALYYCPGEDQYGKTADGRFSSQREAQIDRFEPASRSACE